MDDRFPPRARGPSRKLVVTVLAIVAVIIIAAAATLILNRPGGPLDGMDSGNDGDGDQDGGPGAGDQDGAPGAGDDQAPSIRLREGDYLDYIITRSDGGLNGTMRVTFHNVSDAGYDVEMVQTVNGQVFTLSWRAGPDDALGGRGDEQVGREGLGDPVGEGTINTVFGPRNTVQYRTSSGDGNVTDCYIGRDVAVLYRSMTMGDGTLTTVELSATSIEGLEDANQ